MMYYLLRKMKATSNEHNALNVHLMVLMILSTIAIIFANTVSS